jgi:Chromo (CHRromatin Organisation MOdifier) domain
MVQYVKNFWPSSTTKKTPFELLLGYTPTIYQPTWTSLVPGVTDWLQTIKEHRQSALEALQAAQNWMAKETKYKPFKENDKVWLEGTHLKLPYETMKLAPRQYGPFKVIAKVSDIAYCLKLPDTWKIHNVFHVSLLTPYNETPAHGPNFLEPPLDLIEGELEWEVEQILGDRTYRKKKQYLIQWKGYAPAHDSWQDESDIHALELIEAYKQKAQSAATSWPQSAAQSALAKTPHHQSAHPKTRASTHIRTTSETPQQEHPHEQQPHHRQDPSGNSSPLEPPTSAHRSPLHCSQYHSQHWTTSASPHLENLDNLSVSDWLATLGIAMKKNENSPTTLKPALIQTCQEGGTLTISPMNQTLTTLWRSSPNLTPAGRTSSRDMACRLLDNGSADAPAIMLYTSPYLTLNLIGGLIPPLKIPTAFHLHEIPAGISTYATIPDYSYSGCEAAATSSTQNTMNRPNVAWKQQSCYDP